MSATTKRTAFRNEPVFKAIRNAATDVAKVKASELTRVQAAEILRPARESQAKLKRAF